jgi:hypothetical protein
MLTEDGSIGKMNAFLAENETNEATYQSSTKMVREDSLGDFVEYVF